MLASNSIKAIFSNMLSVIGLLLANKPTGNSSILSSFDIDDEVVIEPFVFIVSPPTVVADFGHSLSHSFVK